MHNLFRAVSEHFGGVIALGHLAKSRRSSRCALLFFPRPSFPRIDGIVTTLSETVRQLRLLGHEVLVFAPDGGNTGFEGAHIIPMKGHAFALDPELRLSLPRAFFDSGMRLQPRGMGIYDAPL